MITIIHKRITATILAFIMILGVISPYSVSAAYENTHVNTGNQREDIVKIAETQIGYCEGSDAGTTAGSNNYAKYNLSLYTINGSYKYSWCHSFVSWCAMQAGVPSSEIKRTAGCDEGMNQFKNQGKWYNSAYKGGTYKPQRGDIIYFSDTSNLNDSTHVGIVYSVDNVSVYTIEGNSSDKVARRSYSLQSSYIIGYGVPNYNGNNIIIDGEYFPACNSGYTSITDALKSIGVDSSYDNRKRIAFANGITDYAGTAAQNTQLLSLLKAGRLINPDGEPVPDPDPDPDPPQSGYFPACDSSFTSIVEALKSIGVDSSYDNRKRIAVANGITDYSGTADQNTQLLSLLKAGLLINLAGEPVLDPDPDPDPPQSGYFPACSSGYASIVEALKSIDVDSSYDNRKRIAIKNGITNYSGTAEQNTQLLSLLKSGKLLDPDYVQPVTTTTTTTTTTTKKTTTTTTTTTKKTTTTTTTTTTTKKTTTTTTTTTTKKTTTTTTTTTKKTTTTTTTTEPKEPIILPHELTLQVGDTAELVVLNCDKPEDIQWISSNKNVAEVKDGVVSGKSVGETTIYAVVNNVYCEAVVIVEEKVSETRPTGDANQDGKVLLNDAVLILQYLGNPDAYPLSDEAKANADVSGNGDGITNKDALAIQRFVLHLIPSLPES